jgi:hypothetical protein
MLQLCDGGFEGRNVFENRRLSDFEPKHQEFAMDPSRQIAPVANPSIAIALRCQSWSGATVANSSDDRIPASRFPVIVLRSDALGLQQLGFNYSNHFRDLGSERRRFAH